MREQVKSVDIDQLISDLPRSEQVLVKRLRSLIIECIPQAAEKTYPDLIMPFFKKKRLICFIWPPSVPWASGTNHEKQKTKGVALGFNQGNLMSNQAGVLLAEGRKQVYMIYFKKPGDIDEVQVRALLFEAAMIDEQFGKKKRK